MVSYGRIKQYKTIAEDRYRMVLAVEKRERSDRLHISVEWPYEEISSKNSKVFQRWINDELKPKTGLISVDLRNVDYVNASGLTAMVRVSRLAVNMGVDLEWINLDPNVAKLMKLTRLDSVLNVR